MNFEQLSKQQILVIAVPIMDNLIDAPAQRDHTRHVHDFTDRLKAIATPDYFECICQQYQAEKGAPLTPPSPSSAAQIRQQLCGNNSSRKHSASLSRKWCWYTGAAGIWWIMWWYSGGLVEVDRWNPLVSILMMFVMMKAERIQIIRFSGCRNWTHFNDTYSIISDIQFQLCIVRNVQNTSTGFRSFICGTLPHRNRAILSIRKSGSFRKDQKMKV